MTPLSPLSPFAPDRLRGFLSRLKEPVTCELELWEQNNPAVLFTTFQEVWEDESRKRRSWHRFAVLRNFAIAAALLTFMAHLFLMGRAAVNAFILPSFLASFFVLLGAGLWEMGHLQRGELPPTDLKYLRDAALSFTDPRLCGVWIDSLPHFRREEKHKRLATLRERLTLFLGAAEAAGVALPKRRLRLLADDVRAVIGEWKKRPDESVPDQEADYCIAVLSVLEAKPEAALLRPLQKAARRLSGEDINRRAVRETAAHLQKEAAQTLRAGPGNAS